jgi:Ran GTPase-activating protein (RanGAP) involved in mRNA processing and transport
MRELEIFDDSEPKTDINSLTTFFNHFKKLQCLTIVGNNMGNKECVSLSNGLKQLKELRILNLSFNCLTDNNISKISFTNNNNKIEVLNLKSNSATEISMEIFKDELIKLKNLKELNFLDNQFGDQGLNHLLQVFNTVNDLRILIISNCNISNLGIEYFTNFLRKNNNYLNKLEVLNLISNPINDECLSSFIYIIKIYHH